jgi:dGTPase
MKNNFYNDFDFKRLKNSPRENDYRSPFQIDRDRIIHSSEFRRLQGKTKVFLPGEYDFYRTRLTHSIEVAQIGRAICTYLLSKEKNLLNENYYIDEDLVESICLAHDLGHPPFGHAGERTLNRLMKNFGGFEGNAQTLRMITEIFYRDDDKHRGMNPTRAFVDGILKYKAAFKQFKKPENHFIYDEQQKYIDFIFNGNVRPKKISSPEKLNQFQCIECQIMDWADDTAYAINDIVDCISGGFITMSKLMGWADKNELSQTQNKIVENMLNWMKTGKYKPQFGSQIGEFIHSCGLRKRKTFMDSFTNRYKYVLEIEKETFEKAQFYKKLSAEIVFRSSQLHQMEFKGNSMIENLFNLFFNNYVASIKDAKLLPDFNDNLIRMEKNKNTRARIICDNISGATDSYAMRMYRRLFDPEYSSLADLV